MPTDLFLYLIPFRLQRYNKKMTYTSVHAIFFTKSVNYSFWGFNERGESTSRICFISLISPRKKLAVSLSLRERLFRTKQTKKEPACSVAEQAGVPIDRVFGLSIDRKGLFYLLTLESIGFVSSEDEYLAVDEDLGSLTPTLP